LAWFDAVGGPKAEYTLIIKAHPGKNSAFVLEGIMFKNLKPV
jgi:hypothetical protein